MTTPVVPPMTLDVEGNSYGGQYWSPANYRMRFEVTDSGVSITIEDASGLEMAVHDLSKDEAQAVEVALKPIEVALSVPGLAREMHWRFNDDAWDPTFEIDLFLQLEEVCSWLSYAIGDKTYPADADLWEY